MPEEEKPCNEDQISSLEFEQVEDVEMLRQSLVKERGIAEKYLANWQRTQADFTNYKKQAELEKKEIIQFANSTLILNLLDILDDFERAFASVPVHSIRSTWIEGVKLIYNKLKSTLEAQGLAEIKAKGEPFDPHLHEAVMNQEGEEGIVIEETQKGYKFKDRVIRPSLVTVGTGKEENEIERLAQKED